MVILPILIVISIVLYIYNKVTILKTKDALTQVYINAKARVCLGCFILLFSINQYIFYQTKVALFIGIVLLILGGMQATHGVKEVNHYRKELHRLNA